MQLRQRVCFFFIYCESSNSVEGENHQDDWVRSPAEWVPSSEGLHRLSAVHSPGGITNKPWEAIFLLTWPSSAETVRLWWWIRGPKSNWPCSQVPSEGEQVLQDLGEMIEAKNTKFTTPWSAEYCIAHLSDEPKIIVWKSQSSGLVAKKRQLDKSFGSHPFIGLLCVPAPFILKVLFHLWRFVFLWETRLFAFGFTAHCQSIYKKVVQQVYFCKCTHQPDTFACVHFFSFMWPEPQSLKRRCDLQLWETFSSLPFLQSVNAPTAAFPQKGRRKNKTSLQYFYWPPSGHRERSIQYDSQYG